jgi:hypothetical protein
MEKCIGFDDRCVRPGSRLLDHSPYCDTCIIDALVEEVERLKTIYAMATVEIRFDHESE